MQIDDLTAGLSLSFIIHLNNEELQFESRILEVYSRRHTPVSYTHLTLPTT